MNRGSAWQSAVFIVLGLATIVVWLPQLLTAPEQEYFSVHFLDVGQGDAVLLQTPDGYEVLIDGGRTRGVLREIAQRQSWWDRSIELVVATHADEDHVGGLVDVLGQYHVDMVLKTEAEGESPGAEAFEQAVALENAVVTYARAGQTIKIGASTTIDILSPATSTSNWRTNAASIILKVTYGDTAVLLTGDAPANIEDYLVGAYGADLRADILKLGHHGSKTSTSDLFLATVQPQYAVVSASVGNQYGHPHQDVISRVFTRGIRTFHTGADGTVSFVSDGKRVWHE